MKKRRLFAGALAALLLANAWLLPARAETEPSTDSIQDTAQIDFSILPWETLPPTDTITGDASVTMGCNTINAQVPLASTMELAVDCGAALVYEVDTDTMIYGYNMDEIRYPASLTKIMTCMVALELIAEQNVDLETIVTVSEEVAANIDPSGSGMHLVAGEELRLIDLLYGLMVESANDAASVIAEYLSGSEGAFVGKMNQRAAQLGCTQTNFANVHGLHDENHYTTARDMARIMAQAISDETFCTLFSTSYYEIEATNKSDLRKLYTTNEMIARVGSLENYDSRVVGGKTGFTTPAGRCLVTLSEQNDLRLITVVMGAENKYGEDGWTVVSAGHFVQTSALLDFCFDRYMPAQILSPNQSLGQFDVQYGSAKANGVVKYATDTVLPLGSDLSTIRYEYDLDEDTLTAPIYAGDSLGVVRVWYQTRCLAQQELYAAVDVTKTLPITVSGGAVNPAREVEQTSTFWHTVLIVILVLLGAIVLLFAVAYVRRAIYRAKRARRRKNRRRSR